MISNLRESPHRLSTIKERAHPIELVSRSHLSSLQPLLVTPRVRNQTQNRLQKTYSIIIYQRWSPYQNNWSSLHSFSLLLSPYQYRASHAVTVPKTVCSPLISQSPPPSRLINPLFLFHVRRSYPSGRYLDPSRGVVNHNPLGRVQEHITGDPHRRHGNSRQVPERHVC